MSNPSVRQPIGSLSVGNVVSAGLRLYRDHFKRYFGLALRATLWSLLPFLLLIPLVFLLILSQQINFSTILLLIVLGLPLFFYSFAKYMANSALISRLAFCELVDKPESLREARRHVDPKVGFFLRTYLLYFLISMGAVIGFYVAMFVLGIIFAVIVAATQNNPFAIIIGSLILIIAFAIALSFLIRFFTRLCMIEVPLAIEEEINATQSIGRSWILTKGYVGRIFLILTVAFLVTLPIYIIVQIAVSGIQGILIGNNPISTLSIEYQILLFIIGYALGLASGVVILPFWQTIKAVMYYDLRARREGLDLQLRDSSPQ